MYLNWKKPLFAWLLLCACAIAQDQPLPKAPESALSATDMASYRIGPPRHAVHQRVA
jgi:hypothetical protein